MMIESIPYTNVMGHWMQRLLRGEAIPSPSNDIVYLLLCLLQHNMYTLSIFDRRVYPNLVNFFNSYANIVPVTAWHPSVPVAMKTSNSTTTKASV